MFSRLLTCSIVLGFVGVLAACAPAATPQIVVQSQAMTAAPTAAPAATSAPPGASGAGQPGLLPPAGQMIIKNADIELLVADSQQALAKVTRLAADDGGYMLSSQTDYVGQQLRATGQMAVPSSQFETALNQLRGLGVKVLKESTSGQDVTADYTDLQARLGNLEATAARVRSFLDASKTVSDSLAVNSQLSDLEGQIEQIKGQMKYYEGRAAFSTISLTLTPVPPVEQPEPELAWNPLRTFNRAASALGTLARTSTDIMIWLVVLTSPLTGLLIAFALARRVYVRRVARRS